MIDPTWIALIGTVTGGVGLKVAEHYLGRSQERSTEASRIRDELRMQITEQREEIKELEDRLAAVQAQYLDLRDKFMQVSTELQIALSQLKKPAP